ncbi:hypothetical protein DL544_16455 [Stenotrophomonas sp. pho]|nr:hypothetical protein DL544_16455 [Stenotrophomonas sp. pho]
MTAAAGMALARQDVEADEARFPLTSKAEVQPLGRAGIPSELRVQVVERADDEHQATYSRKFTVQEDLHGPGVNTPGLAVLDFNLNLPVLKALLSEGAPRKRAKAKPEHAPA